MKEKPPGSVNLSADQATGWPVVQRNRMRDTEVQREAQNEAARWNETARWDETKRCAGEEKVRRVRLSGIQRYSGLHSDADGWAVVHSESTTKGAQ